jgi:hypothetical protein
VLCPESALPIKRSNSSLEEHRRFLSAHCKICNGLGQSELFRILVPCVSGTGSSRQFAYRSGQFDAFIGIGFSCAERKLADCTSDMRSSKPIFIGTRDDLLDMENGLRVKEEVLYRTARGPLTGQLISLRVDVPPDSPSPVATVVDGVDGLDEGMMFKDQISIQPEGTCTARGDSGSLIIHSSTGRPFAVHRASRTAIRDTGSSEQLAVSLAEALGWMEDEMQLPETYCWILF